MSEHTEFKEITWLGKGHPLYCICVDCIDPAEQEVEAEEVACE